MNDQRLDDLLDKRRDARAEVRKAIEKRQQIEMEIAECSCPYKLGQLASYNSKGDKFTAVITRIEFRVVPPYYYVHLSWIDKRGGLSKPRRCYRIESITVLEHRDGKNDKLLENRVQDLIRKGFIRYLPKRYNPLYDKHVEGSTPTK